MPPREREPTRSAVAAMSQMESRLSEKSMVSDEILKKVSNFAKEKASLILQDSNVFDTALLRMDRLPRFDRRELELGKVLGRGQFGVIKEIAEVIPYKRRRSSTQSLCEELLGKHMDEIHKAAKITNGSADTYDRKSVTDLSKSAGISDSMISAALHRGSSKNLNNAAVESNSAINQKKGGDQKDSVLSVNLLSRTSSDLDDADVVHDRNVVAKRCVRSCGKSRYVVKFVNESSLLDPEQFFLASRDLALEAYILSTFEHPNIIKIRGMADDDKICDKNYFVILDRLYETLDERAQKWRRKELKHKGIAGKIRDARGKKKAMIYDEKLRVCLGVASAIEYLHALGIVYRDLKPDNVGFDMNGDVKLFDFGLARELKEKDLVDNGLYNVSGRTGSLCFMAPEVYHKQPYNHKADVYSYGLLLWEIFAMDQAFRNVSAKAFEETVFVKGVMPKINHKWPNNLKSLMQGSWAKSINERFDSTEVRTRLQNAVDDHAVLGYAKEEQSFFDDDDVSMVSYSRNRKFNFFSGRKVADQ